MRRNCVVVFLLCVLIVDPVNALNLQATTHKATIESLTDENLRKNLTSTESFQNRLVKSLLAGFRWGIFGAAVGAFYEMLAGDPSSPPSYKPSLVFGCAFALIGAIRRFRVKQGPKLSYDEVRVRNGQAAGILPSKEINHESYSELLSNIPPGYTHPISDSDSYNEYSVAKFSPKKRAYPLNFKLRYITENGILDSWAIRTFPNYNLQSAVTFRENVFFEANKASDRFLESGFCEVLDNAGKMSGRVVGRATSDGLIWDGLGWTNSLDKTPFYFILPPMETSSLVSILEDSKARTQKHAQAIQKQHEYFEKVTTGATRPGSLSKYSSTFGIIYAENEHSMAFHRTSKDLSSIFHFVVVPKSSHISKSVEEMLQGKVADGDVCRVLFEMNRMGNCFLAHNKMWFAKHYGVLESDIPSFWKNLRRTIQIGFEVGREPSGWLQMHVLAGTLTAEGLHPEFVQSWLSIEALFEKVECGSPTQLSGFLSEEKCSGSAEGVDEDSIPMMIACGVPEHPVKSMNGHYEYPIKSQRISKCEKPYHVTHDGNVFLKMEQFTMQHRNTIKQHVDQGEGWGTTRSWEQFEDSTKGFVGPVEHRSKSLDVNVWYSDDDAPSRGIDVM